jgi:hypothetical protein
MLQVRQDLLKEELAQFVSEDVLQRAFLRANVKSQIEVHIGQVIRQVLGLGVDEFSVEVKPVKVRREVDGQEVEVIDGYTWSVVAWHPDLGEIGIKGSIDATQTFGQSAQTQTQAQSAQSDSSGKRSNWSAVLDLARKYGVEVKPYEASKVSWYVGQILTRIAQHNPSAKNDPTFQSLLAQWRQSKPQNAPDAKV